MVSQRWLGEESITIQLVCFIYDFIESKIEHKTAYSEQSLTTHASQPVIAQNYAVAARLPSLTPLLVREYVLSMHALYA